MPLTIETVIKLRRLSLTLPKLGVILVLDSPKPIAQVVKESGMSLRAVQRFALNSNGMVRYISYRDKKTNEGRPTSRALVRTAKAEKLIKMIDG